MQPSDELLPCPFCGGDADLDYYHSERDDGFGRGAVVCVDCGAECAAAGFVWAATEDEVARSKAEAVATWNRRVALTRGDALAKAEAEVAQWQTWGVVEIMTRNPNVDSFVREKEERIAALEAEITKMARDRDDIVSEIARLRMILAARDAYDRGDPSTPPVTGKPKQALGGDDA